MNTAFIIEDELEPPQQTLSPSVPYPPSLAHDVAFCGCDEEVGELLQKYGITRAEFEHIADLPSFRRELSEWKQKLLTEGYGFKLKLRAIAEAYIPQLVTLMHDPLVAPSVKTDVFKYITKCAGLEPKKDEQQSADSNKITIEINTFGAPPPQPITVTLPPTPTQVSSDE